LKGKVRKAREEGVKKTVEVREREGEREIPP